MMRILQRMSLVLIAGALFFHVIRQNLFVPHTPAVPTKVSAPAGNARFDATSSAILSIGQKHPSRASSQEEPGHPPDQQLFSEQVARRVQANKRSSLLNRLPAGLTEQGRHQFQQQQLRDEIAQQEAADYAESLQLANRQQASGGLTARDQLELEEQQLRDEQAQQEAANYEESLQSANQPQVNANLTDSDRLQLEQQQLRDEIAEQEAQDYEESLQSANGPQASAEPDSR